MIELVEKLGVEEGGTSPISYGMVHSKHHIEYQQTVLGRGSFDKDSQFPWRTRFYLWPGSIVLLFEDPEKTSVGSAGVQVWLVQALDMMLEIDQRPLNKIGLGGVLANYANAQRWNC